MKTIATLCALIATVASTKLGAIEADLNKYGTTFAVVAGGLADGAYCSTNSDCASGCCLPETNDYAL